MATSKPICCPSRAETLTGRYLQNVKIPVAQAKGQCSEGYGGHDDAGNVCCMHVDEALVNNYTFARALHEQGGYVVGMFGKYLNNCPSSPPPGFDAWFANGGGSYFNPSFAVKNIDGLPDGGSVKFDAQSRYGNYSTALIGNYTVEWIKKVAAEGSGRPWFAYVAPKAAHEPFQPADWYAGHWDPSWPAAAPRPPSWNLTAAQLARHHPTVAGQRALDGAAERCIDSAFKDRWRTLMSVDDVIDRVVATVEGLGLLNNTYFLYSSDHGFQLGELNLPQDKRNVYEFDVKIHMLARGPGIAPGSTFAQVASNVDLGPTMLAMAGVPQDGAVDGRSFLPLIASGGGGEEQLPPTVRAHLAAHDAASVAAGWRKSHFIQHYSVGAGSYCGDGHHIDGPDNNFIAVRHLPGSAYGNVLYAIFQWANGTNYGTGNVDFQDPFFFEFYNMDSDPWQMNNIFNEVNGSKPEMIAALHAEAQVWLRCKGASCP
jgi:N-acetylglucosamine-6-sulfatase